MGNKNQKSKIKNQKLNEILLEIIEKKKNDLVTQKREIPLSKLREFTSNMDIGVSQFRENIQRAKKIGLIAEIKLVSPADTSFNPNIEIMDQAGQYEKAGADAISYISEKYYFKGNVTSVIKLASKVRLPILQKDFVIDEYQIYEAKIVGSSALLLIARLVDKKTLKNFVDLCRDLGIEPVVEINDQEDLEKAEAVSARIIAVNARDLSTFKVDVDKACSLLQKVSDSYIKLGFSGVKSADEVKKYKKAGAKGVLVGTSLMKAKNIKEFIAELKNI